MKAVVYDHYGSADEVIDLLDVDPPDIADHEVLVRVRAASVNPYDWHFMTGKPYLSRFQFGLRKPLVAGLGADLAGTVEAVGKGVTRFAPGDEVFGEVNGETGGNPNLELGSFAEFVSVSQDWLAPKPSNLTFEAAASVPMASITALQGLRDYGKVKAADRVLINGASGGVGTFAVQIAKALGAKVTGVCSTRNVDLVRSLGADRVIDYTQDDFTTGDDRYDLILDNVGNRPLSACRRVLAPRGMYLASFGRPDHDWIGPLAKISRMKILALFVSQDFRLLSQHRKKEDLGYIKSLIEEGKISPVIDRTYPLDDVVEALGYLEGGHARGKVVVTV